MPALGLGLGLPFRRTSGPSYDAEAAAYFAAAGITDANAKTAINAFIIGVKADFTATALTDVFDQLVLQANESAAAAVVDMCGRLNQTLVNSPTFTQWQGVTGAAAKYIDMGFNPTTGNASKYTLNNHAFGFFCRNGIGSAAMGAQNSGFNGRVVYVDTGGGTGQIKDSSANMSVTLAVHTGLLAASRTASNATAAYQDGTSLTTSTSSPIAELNLGWVLCGTNGNGSISGTTSQSSLSFISRGMTSGEMAAFSARVQTLKTAIGW